MKFTITLPTKVAEYFAREAKEMEYRTTALYLRAILIGMTRAKELGIIEDDLPKGKGETEE